MQTPSQPLGTIYLPSSGTPVGQFQFVVDPESGSNVEVGTPVAAETTEGVVIGAVMDMSTVGTEKDPVRSDLGASYDEPYLASVREVVLATVQVFHSEGNKARPVRAGIVRAASADEMLMATGFDRMDWAVPAGVVSLADGGFAKVCLDGHNLLGPEAIGLSVAGASGAAKTSFAGVLLKSALHTGRINGERTAALILNVKGEDLVFLDQPPAAGYELTDEDLAIYDALGIPATPFEDVTVYAPSLPGGGGTRSVRPDAAVLRWDLRLVWPYLRYFFGSQMYEDEKLASFLAEFRAYVLESPNPHERVDTFGKLDAWFGARLAEAEETESSYAWRSHHKATMWRIRRMLMGLVSRCGGLLGSETAKPQEDIPVTGWTDGQVVVVDIAGLQTDVQAAVIARTIERIMKSAEEGELGVDHLVIFFDELNAFAPAQGGEMAAVRKTLEKVASQGRYASCSLWGAAQKVSKISEMVRDNLSTRACGVIAETELSSGVFGRVPSGLFERIVTLRRGQMAIWHHTFRGALIVRFPRPAWRTGKPKVSLAGSKNVRPSAMSVLRAEGKALSKESIERLTEGVPEEIAEAIIARADDGERAVAELAKVRVPDMTKVALHEERPALDADNPFDLD